MPNIRKFLDLSTGHLKVSTRTALELNKIEVGHLKSEYGWFVYADEDLVAGDGPGGIPEDLAACLKVARLLGCEYVMFDCDASVDGALPVYDEQTEAVSLGDCAEQFAFVHGEALERANERRAPVEIWSSGHTLVFKPDHYHSVKVFTVAPGSAE